MRGWHVGHSLDSAMKASALWFYQRTASLIGRDRMLASLKHLGYGRDTYERAGVVLAERQPGGLANGTVGFRVTPHALSAASQTLSKQAGAELAVRALNARPLR